MLPAFFGFILFGGIPLWLSLPSLIPSFHAILRHAPLVELSPRDAIGPPLALVCFALAGMTLCPVEAVGPDRTRRLRRKPARGQVDWLAVCLGVAMAAVLLSVISIPIVEVGVSAVMADRGYVACAAPTWPRHAPMRWVAGGGRCPVQAPMFVQSKSSTGQDH